MTNHIQKATDTFVEIAFYYIICLLAAAGLFAIFEGKDFLDSLWWASTTATTVGYGDISPVTIPGRIVAFGLMHLVPFVIAPLLIVRLTSKIIEDQHEFSHEEQEALKNEVTRLRTNMKALMTHFGINETEQDTPPLQSVGGEQGPSGQPT